MTTFSASLTNLRPRLPQSRDCSCCVSRRILARPPLWLQKHTDHTHTNSRTLPTCDISLGSLTLPSLEAEDFVNLIPLLFLFFNCKWVYTRWQCATMQDRAIQCVTVQYNTITHITHNNTYHTKWHAALKATLIT